MYFEYPKLLWLLAVPVLMVLHYIYLEMAERHPHLRVSTSIPWMKNGKTFMTFFRHVPFVLRIFALSMIVVAIARPRSSENVEKVDTEGTVHIDDIIEAARNDDNLSIELIEEAGEKIGKSVAFLINIFNPETVVIGGNLAAAGDYLMLPLKSATNKYSLNLVYKDTKFRQSKMGENANAWGVAMLIHNKIIGL